MTRLRFVRNWSTYRPGDVMVTDSAFTVSRMVGVHQVAEIIDEDGRVLLNPEQVITQPESKAVEAAPKDKMVRRAKKAKARG